MSYNVNFRAAINEKEKYLTDLDATIEKIRANGLADDTTTRVKNATTASADDEQEATIRSLEGELKEYKKR